MSKALLKYIRLSPTKARLIAREIQGMNAELALATLEFTPNKAARVIYKVLASAIANGNYDAQSVIVKSCRIDAGPVLRRMMPRARGRANVIRKPTSHIFVEVIEAKEAKTPKDSAKKATNAKSSKNKESQKNTESAKTQSQKNAESSKGVKKTKSNLAKGDSSDSNKTSDSAKSKKSSTSKSDAKSLKVEDK